MKINWCTSENLFEELSKRLIDSNIVLDIGCGIRPQTFLNPDVHICCDPFQQYLDHLSENYKGTGKILPLKLDWRGVVDSFTKKSVDTIFILDVIEHLEKEEGKKLLEHTIPIANNQVVIFTPLGFVEQHHPDGKDAWGLEGGKMQEHKSGWMPEDFDSSWEIFACKDFHKFDHNGKEYEKPEGAFFALRKSDALRLKQNVESLLTNGEQLLNSGQTLEALKVFLACTEMLPEYAPAHNDLAITYWNLGQEDLAFDSLKKAYEIEPGNEIYFMNYVELLASKERFDEVKVISRKFIGMNKLNDETRQFIEGLPVDLGATFTQLQDSKYIELQNRIDTFSYPQNYAYDILSLEPKGFLATRFEYWQKYSPELLEPCKKFLSIGSSLGYMLLYHSHTSESCLGIEPDYKAVEIVNDVIDFKKINNVKIRNTTFKEFESTEKFDLIWMGNVFHYMYVDFGWDVTRRLAEISNGLCIIEAPLEGSFLMGQANLNPAWKNTELMNNYSLEKFKEEMSKYFSINNISPSGTDPQNRVIVTMVRRSEKKTISIDDVQIEELLLELPFSKIYKTRIDEQDLIYKRIDSNPNMDFELVNQSYNNVKNHLDDPTLVHVYDSRLSKDKQSYEILMEYLESYRDAGNIEQDDRINFATKIVRTIQSLLSKGFLACDAGFENFMWKGNNVKMIDLDFMLSWNQVTNFNVNWFIKKIEEMKDWCPEADNLFDELISEIRTERRKNYKRMLKDPYTEELLIKAKELLKNGSESEALDTLRSLLEIDPFFSKAHFEMASVLLTMGNLAEAYNAFEQAVELEPDNKLYLLNYIKVLHSNNEHKKVNDLCGLFIDRYDSNDEIEQFKLQYDLVDESK